MDSELIRLKKLYDTVSEKYDKRMDRLNAKRDYELGFIWNCICEEQAKDSKEAS